MESRPAALGGSWIKIWMRINGWIARATSVNSVSRLTGWTAVSTPAATSVQMLKQGGRAIPISLKTVSVKVEIRSGSTVKSKKPPKLAVTCTVWTTTRKGRASSGTGSAPDLSVIKPQLEGTRYSRLIHRPREAGQLKAASCTTSSCLLLQSRVAWWFAVQLVQLAASLCPRCCTSNVIHKLRPERE